MASSRRLPPDWEGIKQASIRGVSDATLALTFNVSRAAIRKRRERGRWAGRMAKKASQVPESRGLAVSGEAADAIATASLAEIAGRNSLLVAREVARLVQQTFARGLMKAPANWTELGHAQKMVEGATGQKRGAAMTVNVASMWSSNPNREKAIVVLESE